MLLRRLATAGKIKWASFHAWINGGQPWQAGNFSLVYSSEHKFVESVTCLAETDVLQGGRGFLITRNYIIRTSFSIADLAMLPNCVLFLQVMHCTPGYSRLVSTCGWPSWEHVTLS